MSRYYAYLHWQTNKPTGKFASRTAAKTAFCEDVPKGRYNPYKGGNTIMVVDGEPDLMTTKHFMIADHLEMLERADKLPNRDFPDDRYQGKADGQMRTPDGSTLTYKVFMLFYWLFASVFLLFRALPTILIGVIIFFVLIIGFFFVSASVSVMLP